MFYYWRHYSSQVIHLNVFRPGAKVLRLELVKFSRPPTTLGDHDDSPDHGRGEVLQCGFFLNSFWNVFDFITSDNVVILLAINSLHIVRPEDRGRELPVPNAIALEWRGRRLNVRVGGVGRG